jgi:hypothetical protein
VEWKEYGRKWSWSNSRLYPVISLEGLRKYNTNFSQDGLFLGRDLNTGPPGVRSTITIIDIKMYVYTYVYTYMQFKIF